MVSRVCGLREEVFGEGCGGALECEAADGGKCCAVES